MNIFASEQGILGQADYARQHCAFHPFLAQARSVRRQLGPQAYKLDEYIRQLLIACSIPLEEEFFDGRFSLTGRLASSCRVAASGNALEDAPDGACHARVSAYAQEHPLTNQVANTRTLIYFCSLLDAHLAEEMDTVVQEIWFDTANRTDPVLIDALFHEICQTLGREDEMVRLNDLFLRRFLPVPLRHFAWQIAANELARMLLERDPETSCEIIRLHCWLKSKTRRGGLMSLFAPIYFIPLGIFLIVSI